LDQVEYAPTTGLSLGALVSIRTLELHPLIRQHYPALSQAASTFAGVQIRHLATVGGNVCNASPSGDTLPALLAYGAECRLVSPEGERLVPLEGLFTGPGRTALRPTELLVELRLPPPAPRTGALYIKHSPRSAMDISTVGVASLITLASPNGICQEIRISLGAVAPTVIRARSAEALLRGQRLDEGLIQETARAAGEEARPIDDIRGTARHRRAILQATSSGSRGCTLRESKTMKQILRLTINGEPYELLAEPYWSLLDLLRDHLQLTGTKRGCDEGDCGACTVLLQGKTATACMVLALDANGKEVITVEGLAQGNRLHPVQEAFVTYGGVQCGYCTPGLIMSAVGLLLENPHPTEEDVRFGIGGNLCRCTGYAKVVQAILKAAEAMPAAQA
jgi:carbon-monoxide dehydrogenase medium subunit